MLEFLINFCRLTRPLSNTKNVLIVCLAFFLSGTGFGLKPFLLGIISLSSFCSAVYVFNSFYDVELDKENKNKDQYSKSVSYFGKRKTLAILLSLIILGLISGIFVNLYFVLASSSLLIIGFLYSYPRIRFKEKIILDVLFSSALTFAFRFIAAWFIFKISTPPILPVLALAFVKSGGFMIDKEMDRTLLLKKNIRNSITAISKKTNIIISITLLVLSIIFASLMCLNAQYFQKDFIGYLPQKILFLLPLAIPPIVIIYLKVLNKINIKRKYLRIIGFLYGLLALAAVFIVI